MVNTAIFSEDQLRLNLQKSTDGLFECRGSIQGEYPIYVPGDHVLARKLVEEVHLKTLHGGVGMTTAGIHEKYWIPKLRRLAKQVIKSRHGCKKFQAVAFANPPPGNLLQDRTEGNIPFQVMGVDYRGPILYCSGKSGEGKAYVILHSCSLTRAMHLELLKDMATEQFIQSFKRLVAKKGKPEKVYSDNGETFIAAAKWVKRLKKSRDLANYLTKQDIMWQLNLHRALWWGGQFERLIGLVKKSLFMVIGGAKLKFSKLEVVILDVEVALNNRPLSYVEDDLQFPVLTPNVMMFGKDNLLSTKDLNQIFDCDLRKRASYLECSKQVLWKRWHAEYILALREQHNLKHKALELTVKTGDVVLIKGDKKNHGKWKMGIVKQIIPGCDRNVRAVKLKSGKGEMEQTIQHLYPLELACDMEEPKKKIELDAKATEFHPKRKTAEEAKSRFKDDEL